MPLPPGLKSWGPIGPSLSTLVPMIFTSPIIKKIIPIVKLLLPKLLTLLLHLLYCLKVVNIKFGMFEHFYSALFLVIREQYFLLVSLSRLKERNVTTIVVVFEQQLLTYCLLKYLGCQSVSLCICLVCLSIYLCDYVCLHVFLLFSV